MHKPNHRYSYVNFDFSNAQRGAKKTQIYNEVHKYMRHIYVCDTKIVWHEICANFLESHD